MAINKKENIDLNEFEKMSPEEYEKKYVHTTYEHIANDFSATRYKPWKNVEFFLKTLSPNSIMVDVGCGNGKNLGISPGKSIGCDMCSELLKIAKEKGHEVILCNALELPFEKNSVDVVISIAVIHHFSTQERRINAIKEMLRILKQDGKMMIYVWSNEQNNGNYFVNWTKSYDNNTSHKRYYHFINFKSLIPFIYINFCL